MGHPHEDPVRSARLEAERQFYARFFKFLALLLCFFAVLFFSELEHATVLFFVGVVGFGAYLAYMIGTLAYAVFVTNPRNDISNILTQEEMAIDDEEEDDEAGMDMALCPMEKTPDLVRSCREEITPYFRPKSGRYSVVYNAVYFGKSIRSESELQLRFVEASNSRGWTISGAIISGNKQKESQTRRSLAEGFINARGEMYWTLANPKNETNLDGIYRGCYDFRSSALYDGEFQAGSAPRGRIVRMELQEEDDEQYHHENGGDDWGSPDLDSDWGTHDVEMVELDKSLV